jgi:hypothetical protein
MACYVARRDRESLHGSGAGLHTIGGRYAANPLGLHRHSE